MYGGAGKQAQLLGTELACRGWDVSIVTLDQGGVGSATEQNVDVLRVLKGVAGTNGLRRAATTIGLGFTSALRVLRSRPDAVHVHGAYWWSIPPLLAARVVGASSLVKVTRDGEDDPDTVLGRRVFGKIPVGWLYGVSFKIADFVVTLSNEAFEKADQRLDLKGKVRLIRNGVDASALARTDIRRSTARESHSLGEKTKVTTFVGYLVEHKGVLDLLAAWSKRGTLTDEELWLVGPYDGFYRELSSTVLTTVEEMQAAGYNIRLFGHVDAADMPSIYWATDVFTLPSYAEGMPNSLAEAMVAGCDIVATDIPGITDIVDSNSAKLVRPGDIAALAQALSQAHDEVRTTGSEDAAMRLGVGRTIDLLEGLYVARR
jgi:glycosyltransferase involved in cell wall biosynthesis